MSFSRGSSQHRIEPVSLMSPVLAGIFFTTEPYGKARNGSYLYLKAKTIEFRRKILSDFQFGKSFSEGKTHKEKAIIEIFPIKIFYSSK